jgi:hypothetical protein
MESTAFHKLRTAVQDNANPADAQYAVQLRDSLQAALERSRLFSEIELGETTDPDRLVIGVCRCAADVLPWEAGIGVERLWMTAVLDAQWEAHTVSCNESLMDFEGAVTVDADGHYVTVQIVAEPAVPSAAPQTPAGELAEGEPARA